MQDLRNGLGIRDGILEFYYSFGLVGVNICGASDSDIPYACIGRRLYLGYDVLLIPPKRYAFLGLYTELAPPLVSNTALVQFNLVGEWAWVPVGGDDVWVVGHRSGGCPPKCPS